MSGAPISEVMPNRYAELCKRKRLQRPVAVAGSYMWGDIIPYSTPEKIPTPRDPRRPTPSGERTSELTVIDLCLFVFPQRGGVHSRRPGAGGVGYTGTTVYTLLPLVHALDIL